VMYPGIDVVERYYVGNVSSRISAPCRAQTVKVNQLIFPDAEFIEFICEDRDATHDVGAR
jgi:hypothetical protein